MEDELRAILELTAEYAVKTGEMVSIAGFPDGTAFGFNKTYDLRVSLNNEVSDMQ